MNGLSSVSPSSSSRPGTSPALWWVEANGTLHEQCKVLVFIGRAFLGEFPFDPGAHPEMRYRRSGAAYFCRACGEIWARLVLVDMQGRQEAFEVEVVSCEKHYDQWAVSGSLLAGNLEALLPLLPLAAARREFMIHLRDLEE